MATRWISRQCSHCWTTLKVHPTRLKANSKTHSSGMSCTTKSFTFQQMIDHIDHQLFRTTTVSSQKFIRTELGTGRNVMMRSIALLQFHRDSIDEQVGCGRDI